MLVIKDYINIGKLDDLMRILIRIKSIEYGVNLSDAQINLVIDFYEHGINDKSYSIHLERSESLPNYFKSKATIDNNKSYLKRKKLLEVNGDTLVVSPLLLPEGLLSGDKILLSCNILYDK